MFDIVKDKLAENARIAELEEKIEQLEQEKAKLEEKIKKITQKEQKQAKQKQEFDKGVAETVKIVSELTGWARAYTYGKFFEAHKLTNCTPKEYRMYRFYDRSPEEQKTFFLITHQKALRKKYDASKAFVNIICNKEQTNNYFLDYVRRPWCVNTKVTLEEFKEIFKNVTRVIYKPVGGHRGFGVEAFYVDDANIEESYNKMKDYPEGVVEEFINQHPEMSRLSPASVNTIRFVTISNYTNPVTEDGRFADIAYSMVRIGRGDSIVDNLHSGGMVANVDLETGKLYTFGADRNGKIYKEHPETGVTIKGFQVPFFEEARDMVLEAIATKKVEGYLGWDIAIGVNGPMIVEVNAQPGSDGLQTAPAQEGKGMKHVMDKYL